MSLQNLGLEAGGAWLEDNFSSAAPSQAMPGHACVEATSALNAIAQLPLASFC